MTTKVEVAHSEVEQFLICERRHYYNYGLAVKPKVVSTALYRGTVGHSALQAYYQALKEGKSQSEARACAYGAIYDDKGVRSLENAKVQSELTTILTQYFDHYANEDLVPIEIESRYKLEISEQVTMPFTIDGLYSSSKYGGLILMDHKFTYNFFNDLILSVLPQLVKYMGVLRQYGYAVSKAMYNELRYRRLKSGEYQFRRTPLSIPTTRMDRTLSEHISVGHRIAARKQLPLEEWSRRSLRVANKFSCDKCPYVSICAADLRGADTTLLLDDYYEPALDRYANVQLED
jgi:CRISPR/Cas system-associated exonuclease Cas4 (RecB family)